MPCRCRSEARKLGVKQLDKGSVTTFRERTQQNGWKTQVGRMTKKCRVRLGMHSLAPHFFVILPSWVFQPSSCVSYTYWNWEYQSVQKPLSINLLRVSPEVFYGVNLKRQKTKLLRVEECLMCNNRCYKCLTLCLHWLTNSLKTKQNKVDDTIIRMSHNVTIQYITSCLLKSWHEKVTFEVTVAKCHSNSKRHGLRPLLTGLKLWRKS